MSGGAAPDTTAATAPISAPNPSSAPGLDSDEQRDIAALARGGRTNLAGFFLRLGARIPFLFIAGRAAAYGPAALGRFASALVVIELTAMLCTLGEKRGLALRLASLRDTADARPANVVADGVLLAAIASCLLATVFWLVPGAMFPGGRYTEVDRLMVLAIPPLALTEIWLAALAYRFNVGATVSARAIVEPWTLSIMAGAMTLVAPESGLAIAYLASIYAAALAAYLPFRRAYGGVTGWRPRPAALVRLGWHGLPLAIADAIDWGTRRVDILVLGFFAAPRAVGIYYVAQQVASLPQKLKTSFEPILGPVLTRNLAAGNLIGIARQVSQVGFWITAAQAGIALALGLPGRGVMGLFGPQFVVGTAALALLLAAEVLAAPAVVSEAALIYVARLRNLAISVATIVLQAGLTVAGILLARQLRLGELAEAAIAAGALLLALAFSSLVKARVLARLLGAPVSTWRWALAWAVAPAVLVGLVSGHVLAEWAQMSFGVLAILAVYCWIIWTRGFGPEDRLLFRRTAPA